ncbi:MAG: DUF5682 family protein, partial [Spirochaetales bacterium]|nr:DUF5682 family protein [Spirochaetales bacterium]
MSRAKITDIDKVFQASFDFASGLVYFPVRHHSPACARHLKKTIAEYAPDLILVEGPSDANNLVPYIADPSSVPPFCIYCSYDDTGGLISGEKEKYRAYYPFLEYSPEYAAIKEAAARGIPAEFIDIPYAGRILAEAAREAKAEERKPAETRYRYNENTEYEVNAYTSMLARKAGCRSYAEFWESRYELPAADIQTTAFVRSLFFMAYYMRRAETETQTEIDGEEIPRAENFTENLLREAFMAGKIAAAVKNYARVLVVTGAFHVPGLLAALE